MNRPASSEAPVFEIDEADYRGPILIGAPIPTMHKRASLSRASCRRGSGLPEPIEVTVETIAARPA